MVAILAEIPGLLRKVMCWHLSHCILVSHHRSRACRLYNSCLPCVWCGCRKSYAVGTAERLPLLLIIPRFPCHLACAHQFRISMGRFRSLLSDYAYVGRRPVYTGRYQIDYRCSQQRGRRSNSVVYLVLYNGVLYSMVEALAPSFPS